MPLGYPFHIDIKQQYKRGLKKRRRGEEKRREEKRREEKRREKIMRKGKNKKL